MAALYTAEAIAIGEGRNGEVRSSDGVIDEVLATPKELGGPGGDKTNPEQLFAAGYAACFHGALRLVGRNEKVAIPDDATVEAAVGIGPEGTSFGLVATITATIPGVDQGQADDLVLKAHQVCPYSKATRGNVDVTLVAKT